MGKGLSFEIISDEALRLIDERGFERFSLAALAGSLGVKTASLYNHISGLDELLADVGLKAAGMMYLAAEREMEGKHRRDALIALAFSLWEFAKQHPGLYHLMVRGTMNNEYADMKTEALRVLEPITAAVNEYDLTHEQKVHWHRVIRSVGYGFVLHETKGAFTLAEYPAAETYRIIVDEIHSSLCALENENRKTTENINREEENENAQ